MVPSVSGAENNTLECRNCLFPLDKVFLDLGSSPLANSYLSKSDLNRMEPFYPLRVYVCESCLFVQIEAFEKPEKIFSDYAYFSSYSDSWLCHAETYVEKMIDRFGFDSSHRVVEVGSNDGYLLQYFVRKGIPVLGIEPALNVATVAQEKGVPTLVQFFGLETALAVTNRTPASISRRESNNTCPISLDP